MLFPTPVTEVLSNTLPWTVFLAGTATAQVWSYSLVSFPAAALGIWAGLRMSDRLNSQVFRRLVLWLLLFLGLSLIVGSML